MDRDLFARLGRFLAYPSDGLRDELAASAAALLDRPDVGGSLAAFLAAINGLSLAEWQELYTATFDMNPDCALDIGWHVHGESYPRGAFLARVRALLRETGIAEGTELPDHLTAVLPLLGRLDAARAAALADGEVRPGLAKLRATLAGRGSPYEHVVAAAEAALPHEAPMATTGDPDSASEASGSGLLRSPRSSGPIGRATANTEGGR